MVLKNYLKNKKEGLVKSPCLATFSVFVVSEQKRKSVLQLTVSLRSKPKAKLILATRKSYQPF
jgi:hypothetical protein